MKISRTAIVLLLAAVLVSLSAEAQLKKRVAVARFQDRSGAGYAHIGDGVADMLATALVKSGSFLVLEREEMEKVAYEQQFTNSSMVTPETATQLGKILGAEILIIGSVTEFGQKESNIGGGISVFGAGVKTKTSRAAVDIRLVNVMTGEVLAAETEDGEESTTGIAVRYEDIDFSNINSWDDTDIGKACREAVDKCVVLITDNMTKLPWQGKILKINTDGTLLMKPGSEGNVKVGMEFKVYRPGEEIKDPDTGLSLGAEESLIGSIKVTEDQLKGKAAKAKILQGSNFVVGDLVREE
jgi:curli biogenesis system outer membrane secretion channel CsgG